MRVREPGSYSASVPKGGRNAPSQFLSRPLAARRNLAHNPRHRARLWDMWRSGNSRSSIGIAGRITNYRHSWYTNRGGATRRIRETDVDGCLEHYDTRILNLLKI